MRGFPSFGLPHRFDFDGEQAAAGLARRRGQRDRGDSTGASDLDQAPGASSSREGVEKLGAGRFEIAMALALWKSGCVLVELAGPQSADFGAFVAAEHLTRHFSKGRDSNPPRACLCCVHHIDTYRVATPRN